jgi:hypothetical protein
VSPTDDGRLHVRVASANGLRSILSSVEVAMTQPTKPTYDVFLSHSSQDKTWADAACAVLESRRIRCWIAPRDILPGTEWGASIIEGIDACRVLILILSAHSNASAQVRREVERAISKGLAVLPLRVEDIRPAGALEYAIGNTHWLDAFTPPVEKKLEALAEATSALLGKSRPATPSEAPALLVDARTATKPTGGSAERPEILEQVTSKAAVEKQGPQRKFAAIAAAIVALGLVIAAGAFLARGRPASPSSPGGSESNTTSQKEVPDAAAAASPAEQQIDLLPLIRTGRDNRVGRWSISTDGRTLSSSGSPNNDLSADVIQLPYILDRLSYRLEFAAQAMEAPGGVCDLAVGLVTPLTRFSAILGGWGGGVSGLSLVDGKVADENPTRHESWRFPQGRPTRFVITVTASRPGHVKIEADGTPVVDWTGPMNQLTLGADFGTDSRSLFLAAFDRKFEITELKITPLGPPRDAATTKMRGPQTKGRRNPD